MKIIQIPNLESTAHSHKFKTIAIILMLFLLFAMSITCSIYFSSNQYSAKVYENSSCIEEIFHINEEEYFQVVSILKDSQLFDYLYEIDRKVIFDPSIPKWNNYFTKNEYDLICDFLNKYRPYQIGPTSIGELQFVFLCKNEDVSLFYTERNSDSLSDFLRYVGQHRNIIKLNDNWYMGVRESEVTRKMLD